MIDIQNLLPPRRLPETAALQKNAATKLGAFLLAVGLWALNDSKGSTGKGKAFAKQIEGFVEGAGLHKYGVKQNWLKVYDKPQINQGFVSEIKKAISRKMANDPDLDADTVRFAKFASLFAENPSKNTNYLTRARQAAAQVSAAYLNNFDKVVESGDMESVGGKSNVTELYEQLTAVMTRMLGRKPKAGEFTIPNALRVEKSRADVKYEDLNKEYKAIQRKISVAYDVDYAGYMARNNNEAVSLATAFEHMRKIGYKTQKLPDLGKDAPIMVGIANGKIKHYTLDGRPLAANIPANVETIQLMKTYDSNTGTGAYISVKAPESNGPTRIYTEAHNSAASTSKLDKVSNVGLNVDKFVNRWKKDLKSRDDMTRMGATAALMIYLTGMRVGSRQKSAASMTGKPTYGAISLRPRHIRLNQNSIMLKYEGKASGKSGVLQQHSIKITDAATRQIRDNLEQMLENKRGDDLVFSFTNARGTEKVLTYNQFTTYLAESGYPAGAGIHKIRFLLGTSLVQELLSKKKWKASAKATDLTKQQKEAEDWFVNNIVIPAGDMLGHKAGGGKTLWRTTVKSYLDPVPLAGWFREQGLRLPKWLPAKSEAE